MPMLGYDMIKFGWKVEASVWLVVGLHFVLFERPKQRLVFGTFVSEARSEAIINKCFVFMRLLDKYKH